MENIETIRLFFASQSDGLMEKRKKKPFIHLIMALNIYIFSPIRLEVLIIPYGVDFHSSSSPRQRPRRGRSTLLQNRKRARKRLNCYYSYIVEGKKSKVVFSMCCPLSTLSRIYTSLKLQQLPVKCHGEHPRLHDRVLGQSKLLIQV